MHSSLNTIERRKRVAWRSLGGLILLAFLMQLEHGRSFMGSLILSPLVVLAMLRASLPVSLAWLAAIVSVILAIGAGNGSWANTFRKTALAIAIGLTPHVLFLMELNAPLGPLGHAETAGWPAFIAWYEPQVSGLQDSVGDYLMPALLAGTVLSVTMLLVARWIDSNQFDRTWELIKDGMRFGGVVLATATTFTVMTGMPSGAWEPDARQVLKAEVASLVKSKVRLAVYSEVRDELQSPQSNLLENVREMSATARWVDADDAYEIVREMHSDRLSELRIPRNADAWKAPLHEYAAPEPAETPSHEQAVPAREEVQPDRAVAREQAEVLRAAALDIDQQVEAVAKEVAGICASVAGTGTEAFGGKLLGVLMEDAVGRVVTEILLTWRGSRDALRWVSGEALPHVNHALAGSLALALTRLRTLMADLPGLRAAQRTVEERGRREEARARTEALRRQTIRRGR